MRKMRSLAQNWWSYEKDGYGRMNFHGIMERVFEKLF
jgi:hypothetical protein